MLTEQTLDHKWSEVIRLLYSNKCVVCRKEGTAAHHIVYRRNRAFRYHPLNGVLLCQEHHDWAHKEKEAFTTWLREKLPAQYKFCVEDFHINNVTIPREDSNVLLNDTKKQLTKHIIGSK